MSGIPKWEGEPVSLAEMRSKRGLSIGALVSLAHVGFVAYREYELGTRVPQADTKRSICAALGCEVWDILWPNREEDALGIAHIVRHTFTPWRTYIFIPIAFVKGLKNSWECIDREKRRLKFVRDYGVNHCFYDPAFNGFECFTDAQLMDFAVAEKEEKGKCRIEAIASRAGSLRI